MALEAPSVVTVLQFRTLTYLPFTLPVGAILIGSMKDWLIILVNLDYHTVNYYKLCIK